MNAEAGVACGGCVLLAEGVWGVFFALNIGMDKCKPGLVKSFHIFPLKTIVVSYFTVSNQ